MGMFDSVIAFCPKCGTELEFQSKAGPCLLRNYNINSIPPNIAEDINGDILTCKCGYIAKISLATTISRVSMVINTPDTREYD